MSLTDRFLRYVGVDTQSDHTSDTVPSTPGQCELAQILKQELAELGIEHTCGNGVVYAHLPATGPGRGEPVGFLAHMDTAEELTGRNVRPRIIPSYDGGIIRLNDTVSMAPSEFPALSQVIGDDLIVTDGTTLLGGDDKAGVAAIMQALDEIRQEDHRELYAAFTTDEEIGRGADHFDLEQFPAAWAWTVDGDAVNQVDWETFNAACADLTVHGVAIHPGEAKGKMVNAVQIAADIAAAFPADETPAETEGRQGFWHLTELAGTVEEAHAIWIIRDHDTEKFEERKAFVQDLVSRFETKHPGCLDLRIHDQYLNMARFAPVTQNGEPEAVREAREAVAALGLKPESVPVRGGTDGAMLSAKGLFTPNLGTGSWNHHGRYEFASVQKMETMKNIVKTLMKGRDK